MSVKVLTLQRVKPIVTILLYTGLRVGELTGLTWDDVDFENNTITVNRALTYYRHADGKFRRRINTPKTPSAYRAIPMLSMVREAFIQERRFIEQEGVPTDVVLDGVSNFVFINLDGNVKLQSTINQSLRRNVRKFNEEAKANKKPNEELVLLPTISCHILRHTFATRQVEADINMKVIQESLGHSSIVTTMDIYATVTDDLKKDEFNKLQNYFDNLNM